MEELSPRTVGIAAVGVVVGLVVLVGLLFALGVLGGVQVVEMESEWGAVSANTTEIATEAVVHNPNPVGMPGLATVAYTVSLDDVVVADGREGGIGLGTGNTTVEVATEMDNSKIPEWWVTHVNHGEQSNLTVEASVGALGTTTELEPQVRSIETDVLGPFAEGGRTNVTVRNETLLTVSDRDAAWGEATAERTPMELTARIENVHDRPVELAAVGYTVEMNGVVLGSGESEGFSIAPGERETVEITAALDTEQFGDWWPEHVRDDERSVLTVETYAVVENDGERVRLPLSVFEKRLAFETDLLGEDNATVESLPTEASGPAFEPVTVGGPSQRWGEVTDATTEVITTVPVENPNTDAAIRNLLSVSVDQRTTINGVEAADETDTVEGLPAGDGSLSFTTTLDNDAVPAWWARHLNRGERTTVETDVSGRIDVGVTTLRFPVEGRSSTTETDLLAEMNTDEDREIGRDGRPILVATRSRASWGNATPETAPIETSVTLRNERALPVTIRDVRYVVTINDVVLANRTDSSSWTVPTGATRTIDPRFVLDNAKMDEWWVTHVRNDETSRFEVNATATVEVGGRTERVPLDLFPDGREVRTDLLGSDDESQRS